jgi:hypothetical protein
VSNLSPELQRLVVARRIANQPTDVDRERVFTELQARLGLAAGMGTPVASTLYQSTARTLVVKTASIAVATLAIVAGGVALMYSQTRSPVPEVVSSPTDSIVSVAQSTNRAAETGTSEVQIPMLPQEARSPVEEHLKTAPAPGALRGTNRTRDSLSEEVAILSSAQAELHSGRAESALRLLAEHERKYRHGILAEERTAAKVQALCALGRVSEANALLGRLSPQSLSGDSARQACSLSKKVTPGR